MAVTTIRGQQITDGDVGREDLNTTTAGRAVVRKIIAGSNITISSTGTDSGTGDVTINASGGGGVTTIGTINSQAKSANGAVISGSSLFMQTADGTNPGLISTGTQTIAGAKTFDSRLTVSAGGLSVTSTTSQNNIIATSGNTLIEATPNSTTSNVLVLRNNNPTTSNATFCLALDSVNTATSMDIRLGSTNPKGLRMYASEQNLAAAPTGAAFQMFTNSQPTFPGQLYFDSGANNSAAIIFRTSTTGNNATERLRIFSDGNIGIAVAGTNGGFKFDVNGTTRLQGDVTISDTRNFILATGTGTKIGTATTQKLGFWNATPIVQPTTGVAAATRAGGGGTTVTDTDTFDGYTIAQVVKALRNTGLLA